MLRLLVVALLAVSSAYAKACPQGWHVYNDHCYQYNNIVQDSWCDAVETCNDLGGYVVEIDSPQERAMLKKWTRESGGINHVWIRDDSWPHIKNGCEELTLKNGDVDPEGCDAKLPVICERVAQ